MKRRWPPLAALLAGRAAGGDCDAASAFANGSLDGTGQGADNGALNTPKCGDLADLGGIDSFPDGADANNYLLWVFTIGNGNTVTQATLTTNGDTVTWPTDSDFT